MNFKMLEEHNNKKIKKIRYTRNKTHKKYFPSFRSDYVIMQSEY